MFKDYSKGQAAHAQADQDLVQSLQSLGPTDISAILYDPPNQYTRFPQSKATSPSPATQLHTALQTEQNVLESAIKKKREFQGNLSLIRTGKEKRTQTLAKMVDMGQRHRTASDGVLAATHFYIALISGSRHCAFDLYQMLLKGEGVARNPILSTIFLCVAFDASALTPREIKENKVKSSDLDARMHARERAEWIQTSRGLAAPYRPAIFAAARAIYRAMQEGEHAFRGLGISEAVGRQHLEETDAKVK